MTARRRVLAFLLALTVLALCGCREGTGATVPSTSVLETTVDAAAETTVPEATEPQTTDDSGKNLETGLYPENYDGLTHKLLPETVDNPDNLPVLKWVVLTSFQYIYYQIDATESAVVAINEDLAARGMPFRIQLEVFSLKEMIKGTDQSLHYDVINFPEVRAALEDADLVFSMFTDEEMKTYLQPITEYTEGSGEYSLENAVPHEVYWSRTTLNGEIYGVPTMYCTPKVQGWDVNERVLEEYGLSVEDFYGDFWEMDEVFAQIYRQNGRKGFLELPGTGVNYAHNSGSYIPQIMYSQLYYEFMDITSCFAIDYTSGEPKVVNYLETEYVRNTQQAISRYYSAGYYTPFQLYQYVSYKSVDAGFEYLHDEYWWTGYGYYAIPIRDVQFMCTNQPVYASGISVNTDQKENALALLKLIAEDEAFQKLMLFGVESKDYEVVEGIRKVIYKERGNRYECYYMDYLSPMSNFCGFKRSEYDSYPVIKEGSTALESYQETLEDCTVWYPLDYDDFDLTGLEAELEAIDAILVEYLPQFHTMSEDTYEEMLAKIDAAGGNRVEEALQQQFAQWVLDNIEWIKAYG